MPFHGSTADRSIVGDLIGGLSVHLEDEQGTPTLIHCSCVDFEEICVS